MRSARAAFDNALRASTDVDISQSAKIPVQIILGVCPFRSLTICGYIRMLPPLTSQ